MKTTIQHVSIACGLALLAHAASATTTLVFQDAITSTYNTVYPNSSYTAQNPAVIMTQSTGSDYVKTTSVPFVASPGNTFVEINSGQYGQWITLAVPATVTDRYGQIYARIGVPSGSQDLRLALSSLSNPVFPNYNDSTHIYPESFAAGAGADLFWGYGNLYYYNGTTLTSLGAYAAGFEDVTINYDRQLHTYDVWLGANQIVTAASFEDAGFGNTARSIAIGGAWWGATSSVPPVLDQWYWQSDNTTKFKSFGFFVPEPSSLMLLGLGAALVYARRRR